MNKEDRFRKAEQGDLFPLAIIEEQNKEDSYKVCGVCCVHKKGRPFWTFRSLGVTCVLASFFIFLYLVIVGNG